MIVANFPIMDFCIYVLLFL